MPPNKLFARANMAAKVVTVREQSEFSKIDLEISFEADLLNIMI